MASTAAIHSARCRARVPSFRCHVLAGKISKDRSAVQSLAAVRHFRRMDLRLSGATPLNWSILARPAIKQPAFSPFPHLPLELEPKIPNVLVRAQFVAGPGLGRPPARDVPARRQV